MKVTVVVSGGARTRARLQRLGAGLHDFDDAMGKIGSGLADYYSTVPFLSEGGVYGENWKPLESNYERQKVRMYPGRGILQRTLKMQNGFRSEHGKTFATVRNRMPYFKYLQLGTVRMPQRLIMSINKANVTMITKVLQADIERKLRQA